MPDYPLLSTRLIGEAESALGALLAPLLAEAELTFLQWVALSLITANAATGPGIGRDQLVDLIASARKVEKADASAAVSELERAAALVVAGGQVSLTDAGQTRYGQVRARVQEITERIFDLPGEDLAVAGRVLAVITTRANDVLADTAHRHR
jgi:DNA-binding MarR family transcriptional regulator